MRAILRKHRQDAYIIFLLMLLGLISVPVLTYFYFAGDLVSKQSLMNRNNTGVTLLDRNDQPFFTFYSANNKTTITIEEVPEIMQHSVIAAEDKDFYSHPGFSLKAIARSLYEDITKRSIAFGGSTITQQLVKNVLLTSQKSFLRKYQEIVLAQEIERRYSKQEILEMYLNSVYFGEGAFGVEDASLTYFGKHASDLTLSESSVLAGLLPSPSRYSPLSGGYSFAKERQRYVLSEMVRSGYITKEEADTAYLEELVFTSTRDIINVTAPHFALYVRDELISRYGEERISRSGFKVRTSLDLAAQTFAEKTVENQIDRLQYNKVSNGATVAIDPKTGEILVMVGSKDWYDETFGKYNIITATRQPGSSFKPIVYAQGLERRLITPATLLHDVPTTFGDTYKPQDYDKGYRGDVTVRRALATSLNIPAVEVMQKVGVSSAIEMAKSMGITTLTGNQEYGLSLVLGTASVKPLEMTNVYAAFANSGEQFSPTAILSIKDKIGKEIYAYRPSGKNVINENVAFQISSILSDRSARAETFGSALNLSRPAAVKTGTTEEYRDAWTIGYTPSLVVGVWVGNNDNTPMDQVAGSLGAAPIWRLIMEKMLSGTPIERFRIPSGITAVSICRSNGYVTSNTGTTSAMTEYFLLGSIPSKRCDEASPSPSTADSSPTPSQPITDQVTPSPITTPVQETILPVDVIPSVTLTP